MRSRVRVSAARARAGALARGQTVEKAGASNEITLFLRSDPIDDPIDCLSLHWDLEMVARTIRI